MINSENLDLIGFISIINTY